MTCESCGCKPKETIPGMIPKRGKVRDIYDFGDKLLLVGTDRISAFDYVLPTEIPDKGKVLNQLSAFWFDVMPVIPNHMITTDVDKMPLPEGSDKAYLAGRSVLVHKCKVVPIECIVRGYLTGSGWAEYQKSGTVCGQKLPEGLRESDKLPEPIFTPSTKAETGHDENITFEQMVKVVGQPLANSLREKSFAVYTAGAEYALSKGIILADTKFEFGIETIDCSSFHGDACDPIYNTYLIDEVLTPDSSRFWDTKTYEPGKAQVSLDKQYVRDYLSSVGWDKNSPPPVLPAEVVENTRRIYLEAFRTLTGKEIVCT